MSGLCPRIAFFCLGFVLCSTAPVWADGDNGSRDVRDRWIPSLTFDVLLHDWEESGSLDTFLPDCSVAEELPIPVTPPALECGASLSGSGSSAVSAVQYRLGLDLMSPRIDMLSFIFSPRAWVFGGILINPKQTHSVMKSPANGQFNPEFPENQIAAGFPPPFKGIVAEISSQYLETGWFVGLGSVFELPYRDSMFRFKVAVNYLRERVSVNARFSAAQGGPYPPYGALDYSYEAVRADLGQKRKAYHYLGPIGEIEMVLVPGSRLSFSLYGQVQFLWNLDPSAVVLTTEAGGGTSTFTYRPDDFAVRGAIGMRLAWRAGF